MQINIRFSSLLYINTCDCLGCIVQQNNTRCINARRLWLISKRSTGSRGRQRTGTGLLQSSCQQTIMRLQRIRLVPEVSFPK